MRFSALGWLYVSSVAALFIISYPHRGVPVRWVEQAIGTHPLAHVKTWRYQPGDSNVADLAADPSDVLVIGFTKTDGSALTADDVARIKRRALGRDRIVLAYFSVGTISGDRLPWNASGSAASKSSPPRWVGEESCERPREFRVRFWDEDWKKMSFRAPNSYLRHVIAAGFDGAYLADVDAYRDLKAEQPSAFWDMIDFVSDFARTARSSKPGFLIVPENGEALLEVPEYRRVIDAVGSNGLLFDAGADGKGSDTRNVRWSMAHLEMVRAEGKPVFAVEHLTDAATIDAAALQLRDDGFVPTFDGGDLAPHAARPDETGTIARPAGTCSPGSASRHD